MSTPEVWSRFTKVHNGKELKFRVQELPKDKGEEFFELYFKHYIEEEPIHKASKLTTSEKAFNEYKSGIKYVLENQNIYQIDICCLDDDAAGLKIVGGSLMILEKNGDPIEAEEDIIKMLKTEEMLTFLKLNNYVADKCKLSKKFNLESLYDGRGAFVDPLYRGIGIAGEMLKARVEICKKHGVPMTGAWMTSIGTQKAAARLGWEIAYELQFKDVEEATGVSFKGSPPTSKLMYIKV